MTLHVHHLKGCAPAPLAFYLKALGILRLVSEQADSSVRGWWQDEHFCLLTRMSREELETFFLERYEPTPLLSPWNKGCGFFKPGDPGLAPLEQSKSSRFEVFRLGVSAARELLDSVGHADSVIRAIKARTKTNKSFQTDAQRQLLAESEAFQECVDRLRRDLEKLDPPPKDKLSIEAEIVSIQAIAGAADQPPTKAEADRLKASAGYKRLLAIAERRFKALKATLIPDCRRRWRGSHADWLSSAFVLDEAGEPEWAWLLGTGGNDGNLDFTNNYMQQLGSIFDIGSEKGLPRPQSAALLGNCLWDDPAKHLASAAIGQYQPGAAGGANSSTGFSSGNLVNAWDFVLMMEGCLIFSARATRRLDPNNASRASAPFALHAHAAGYASTGSEKAQRGEQWMPLWSQPATLPDVAALFGEARVQLKRQSASRPVDAARAIGRLGVARGITGFTRFGYLERNGQSTLAVPLGRIAVRQHPNSYLIDDLAQWLDRLQRRARDKHAPARLQQVERNLADAVLAALTHDPLASRWQAVLEAAVAIESLQANGTGIDAGPIPPLRPEWVRAVDGESSEVRLALALGSAAAGYSRDGWPVDSIRRHWLPLDESGRKYNVSDKRLVNDPRVVAFGRDAVADCAAIVDRRLIEAAQRGARQLPLVAASRCSARLGDIAALLNGQLDFQKVVTLARAFMAIKWHEWHEWRSDHYPTATTLPADIPDGAWLAVRLACLARPLPDGRKIPAEPALVRRLMSGDSAGAVEIALRRLRSSGIRPPLSAGLTDNVSARLWAAALAFPISAHTAQFAAETLDPALKGPVHA